MIFRESRKKEIMKAVNIQFGSSRVTAKRSPGFRDRKGRFRKVRYSSIVECVNTYGAEVRMELRLNHELAALKASYWERYGCKAKRVCLPLRYGRVLGIKPGDRVYGVKVKDIGHGIRKPLVLID